MRPTRPARTLSTWIAVLAILVSALLPSVSQALGAASPAAWVEVCSAQGSKWIPADEGGSDTQGAEHLLEHCPYCSLHTPTLALPPVPPPLTLRLDLGHAVPAAFLSAPVTLHAWRAALPRAPPAQS